MAYSNTGITFLDRAWPDRAYPYGAWPGWIRSKIEPYQLSHPGQPNVFEYESDGKAIYVNALFEYEFIPVLNFEYIVDEDFVIYAGFRSNAEYEFYPIIEELRKQDEELIYLVMKMAA